MKRGTECSRPSRGRLIRPPDLREMVLARVAGQSVVEAKLDPRIADAVSTVVRKQVEAGVDIMSDGEISKPQLLDPFKEATHGVRSRDAVTRHAPAGRARLPRACGAPRRYVPGDSANAAAVHRPDYVHGTRAGHTRGSNAICAISATRSRVSSTPRPLAGRHTGRGRLHSDERVLPERPGTPRRDRGRSARRIPGHR